MDTHEPLANILTASGNLDPTRAFTEIHLADGRILRLDTRTFAATPLDPLPTRSEDAAELTESTLVPLLEERLTVDKRIVEIGKVRLHKTVQEHSESLDEPLNVYTYDVERIILNKPINELPTTRLEGDTTIYPLVEEQLVLTKQLILKEEVRVTRRHSERRDTRVITLRREHLTVEREPLA